MKLLTFFVDALEGATIGAAVFLLIGAGMMLAEVIR